MNIKFETLPKYRIAYVRQMGPYCPANVQTMQKLKKVSARKGIICYRGREPT